MFSTSLIALKNKPEPNQMFEIIKLLYRISEIQTETFENNSFCKTNLWAFLFVKKLNFLSKQILCIWRRVWIEFH